MNAVPSGSFGSKIILRKEFCVSFTKSDESKSFTYGYKMQTEIADEMIENGIETDSYAKSRVVPEYKPSSYSWLNRLRHGGTAMKMIHENQFSIF